MSNILLKLCGLDEVSICDKGKRNGWIAIGLGILALVGTAIFFIKTTVITDKIQVIVERNAERIYADPHIPKDNANIDDTLKMLADSARLIHQLPTHASIIFLGFGLFIINYGIFKLRVHSIMKMSPLSAAGFPPQGAGSPVP